MIERVWIPLLAGLHVACGGAGARDADQPAPSHTAAGSTSPSGNVAAGASSTGASSTQDVSAGPALKEFRGQYPVGFADVQLPADDAKRPGLVSLWYPAQAGTNEEHHPYLLASGHVAVDAPPREVSNPDERLPVVVLSHGAGGSATDYPWLSETLASHGFLVVGIEHYGESRRHGLHTADDRAPLSFWLRPPDVHRGLSFVLDESQWASRVDADRLYGVGHSAGGHTLLAAAGLPYTPERLRDHCANAPPEDLGCRYPREYGPPPEPPEKTLQHRALPFDGVVLLEPALTQSFAPETLQGSSISALLVAGRPGDFLPFESHALYLAKHFQPRTTLVLPGASHFSFLGQCNMQLSVFDVPLCGPAVHSKEQDGRDLISSKKEAHRRTAEEVLHFLLP